MKDEKILSQISSKLQSKFPWIGKLFLLMGVIGPGIITANIDNDAGGIATYSHAGAETGYRLIFVMIPITIALILVQEMSARMGIVSGKGLADLIREKFGLKVTFYTLLLLILADLGNTMAEFAGIAAAAEIFGISKYISVPLCSCFVWLLIVKGNYKIIERVFMAGCFVYLSYIISGLIISPPWMEILHQVVKPNFDKITKQDFPIIVGLIGTTITPWMQFYIQSAVVEKGLKVEELNLNKIDVIVGCLFMLLVSAFIVICCAATLYQSGIQIKDAKDAALSLAPLAGDYSTILFGIGLFNASLFAAALLPMATSYYVCEGMGWESGVDKSYKEAPEYFNLFTALIIIGAGIILIPHIQLFKVLIWSQIVNGVLIPIVLIFIVNLCNDPDVMGQYTNSKTYNFFCHLIVTLMVVVNGILVYLELEKFF